MSNSKFTALIASMIMLMGLMVPVPTLNAGDIFVSNNSGDRSTVWYTEGEPSVVINGFDLSAVGVGLPLVLDAVNISIVKPMSDLPARVLVYRDEDGGSPENAELIYQEEVYIGSAGLNRFRLSESVSISTAAVWVGFYLPVGVEFEADRSGSSVLTYWAWTPGDSFPLEDLSSAVVLGPADGTAPVNLDMGGIARIGLEMRQPNDASEILNDLPLGIQLQGYETTDLEILENYPYCGEELYYDPLDVSIGAQNSFDIYCRADLGSFSPSQIANINSLRIESNNAFERASYFYDIFALGAGAGTSDDAERLLEPVTHCMRPDQEDLDRAVLGLAYGTPRKWHIIPSMRFEGLVCGELTHTGFIALFVPRTGDETYSNANLTFASPPITIPNPLECGEPVFLDVGIINDGLEDSPRGKMLVQDRHVRTGSLTALQEFHFDAIPAGGTWRMNTFGYKATTAYIDELHELQFIIDYDDQIAENQENDNVYLIQYVMRLPEEINDVACIVEEED